MAHIAYIAAEPDLRQQKNKRSLSIRANAISRFNELLLPLAGVKALKSLDIRDNPGAQDYCVPPSWTILIHSA